MLKVFMKKILLTTAIVGALLSGSTALGATNDYVNYWKFDEGMGRSAGDSVGGQNGALFGSSTGFGWASGKVGTALGMDGTMGTGVALPNGILAGSQGSISLWLDMKDLSDHNIIFSAKSTTDNNIYAAFAVDRDGRPQFQFRDTTNGNDRKAQATRLLNKNEWYNLTFTANTLSYHVYVNGEEVVIAGDNIGRWFPDITNQTWSYRIGALDAVPLNGSFNGYLDDVRVYNRALTADEARALYTEGNAARPTVPAAVAPKVSFNISEDHISFGGSVLLNWSTVNSDACVASGSWNDAVGTSGSKVFVKLGADAAYTLTCSNAKYGSDVSTVKVFVGKEGATSTQSTATITAVAVTTMTGSGVGTMPQGLVNAAWKRSLKVGTTGEDVTNLQLFLIRHGFLAEGNAIGFFGPRTKTAVMQFQKANGLAVVGVFGPMTRAKVSSMNTDQ